jgi:hypothetical protein
MKKLSLTIALLAGMVVSLFAQTDYYYAPNGEHIYLNLCTDKIVVKLAPEATDNALIWQHLSSISSVSNIGDNRMVVTGTTTNSQLTALRRRSSIQDAYYMVQNGEGSILKAFTNKVFVKQGEGVDIDDCLTMAGLTDKLSNPSGAADNQWHLT